ncbi:bsd domain [Trichoderma cornu-damae]|uniref:Bsd domain n=1 Tax=Trichoderma cornu-damae TaxID=654480 RepID=A0A9P8QGF8_9HYPO|nr:bsd domain [Trichoderma cornu-damae]
MDLAYDHIQEESYIKNAGESGESSKQEESQTSLNNDIQEAYKAFSASPWGAKIGGFFGNVIKQGESVYNQASKEFAEVGEDAQKGFTSLRETIANRTRSLSLTTIIPDISSNDAEDSLRTPTNTAAPATGDDPSTHDSETVLSRLRTEATKRLKDLQRAEDAADEALLRFGSNIRDFLRDAISVAPPDESNQGTQVMFESKDAQGKRVIHTSRFDAQLHVIHTSTESFTRDPSASEYEQWTQGFDIDEKTDDISGDLAKYPELRGTMEKLVPDQIPYADFWKRYYFLRHGIETAESRRRDLLKAASAEDEVGWDDDSEEEEEEEDEKPASAGKPIPATDKGKKPESVASSATIQPPAGAKDLKPDESRKSNDEKSEAETDASYDVVGAASGKTSQLPSRTPNSPKDPKKKGESEGGDEGDGNEDGEGEEDDSDEDWE